MKMDGSVHATAGNHLVEHNYMCAQTAVLQKVSLALDDFTIFSWLFIPLVDCFMCFAGQFQLMHVFLVFHSC